MQEPGQTKKLKIVICDDEPLILQKLREITENTFRDGWDVEIIGAVSPQQLKPSVEDVSIAVLDIQLPEQTGIEVARQILRVHPNCRIIFVSGFVRYVSDVYDVPHVCMVLKDQIDTQLPKFLLRAAAQLTADQKEMIMISANGNQLTVDLKMIYYLERQGHITYVKLRNGQVLKTREKLGDLVKKASDGSLCKCHISYVVNLQWVRSMGQTGFAMQDGEQIPISRSNKQTARNMYFNYLKELV